jgi:hypothetical protein
VFFLDEGYRTSSEVLMRRYKRNQVEEAIAAALSRAEGEPVPDLRVRLKRLLDTDVGLPRDEVQAFSSGVRPGRGMEVWFSPYEAFALLLGLLLLQHRWSQGTVVRIMRQARPRLEAEHARLLALDPVTLLDSGAIERQAAPGSLAVASTEPVFLALVSAGFRAERDPGAVPLAVEVCRGEDELMRVRRDRSPPGTGMTVLELTATAHGLAHALSQVKPKTRGRPGR